MTGFHVSDGLYIVLMSLDPLTSTHPEIAKEANGWDPSQVKANSRTIHSWLCGKGQSGRSMLRVELIADTAARSVLGIEYSSASMI